MKMYTVYYKASLWPNLSYVILSFKKGAVVFCKSTHPVSSEKSGGKKKWLCQSGASAPMQQITVELLFSRVSLAQQPNVW